MISKNVNCKTLYLIAFLVMLVSLYFLIFDAVHARKVFYTAGYASIAIFLFSLRKTHPPKKEFVTGIVRTGIFFNNSCLALHFL